MSYASASRTSASASRDPTVLERSDGTGLFREQSIPMRTCLPTKAAQRASGHRRLIPRRVDLQARHTPIPSGRPRAHRPLRKIPWAHVSQLDSTSLTRTRLRNQRKGRRRFVAKLGLSVSGSCAHVRFPIDPHVPPSPYSGARDARHSDIICCRLASSLA